MAEAGELQGDRELWELCSVPKGLEFGLEKTSQPEQVGKSGV